LFKFSRVVVLGKAKVCSTKESDIATTTWFSKLSAAEHVLTSDGLLARQGGLQANPQGFRRTSHSATRQGER
jgi:hypothetical protein